MCPMASLNKLFPDPCKSIWNSSMVLNGGRIFPPKRTFGSHIGFSYCFNFSNLPKCLEEDPKLCILIIH